MIAVRPDTDGTSLADIARDLGVNVVGDGSVDVHGVSLDSREIHDGDLYAALPGSHAHGAEFARDAVAAGARAVLTDRAGAGVLDRDGVACPRLVVENPRTVLGSVCARVYDTKAPPMRLFGVTGTNGKTTTAYILASALEVLGHRVGIVGTVETRIGTERLRSVRTTPEAPEVHALIAVMVQRGIDDCVMEVSSHALRLHRVDAVRYDMALFTNLSQDHLDFHTDMEDYFSAKAELFTPARSRHAIVCVDDEWGRRLARTATVPVTTIGSSGTDAEWLVIVVDPVTSTFRLAGPGLEVDLRSVLPGHFNMMNTAMAALALHLTGVSPDRFAAALLTDPHVPGRMERVLPSREVPGAPLAVVDFAHTPRAVAVALEALRPTTTGSLVAVLGAGGDRDRGKRAPMGRAAAAGADVVVVTDDNPRSEDPAAIRAAVIDGAREVEGATVVEVGDRQEAIVAGVRAALAGGSGSTIAVLGKGHEIGQDVGGVVHHFDDRDELRAALDAALADHDDVVGGDVAP